MDKKIVYLLVGISGSGKTTRANVLLKQHPAGVICSIDPYMQDPERGYWFRMSKLTEAHKQCRKDFLKACMRGVTPIIVDNLNLSKDYREYYINKALAHGYVVYVEVLDVTPEVAAKRNTHGVDLPTLKRMSQKLDMTEGVYSFGRLS